MKNWKTTVLIFAGLLILGIGLSSTAWGAGDHSSDPGSMQDHKEDKITKHFDDSLAKLTDNSMYSLELVFPDKRLRVGVNTVDIIVHHGKGGDVEGARIIVTPWMPSMGHGVMIEPVIGEKGRGLYTASNVGISMPGHWQLKVEVEKDGMSDTAVFDIRNIQTLKKSSYIKVRSPAGNDVVIGAKNTLKELHPEILKEDGRTIKAFKMTIKDVGFDIFPGQAMHGWGFDGSVPGPTIRVKEGDRIRITIKNETNDGEHTLHIHGQSKPVIMDGVPYLGQKPIAKGESYTYEFTVSNIGTSWYHCHVDSAHHVDMGMYGAFIVEPKKEKFEYDREYVMLLDEWPTAHVHKHEEPPPTEGDEEHTIMTQHEGSPPMHEHEDEKPAKRDWYPKTHAPRNEIYDGFTINGRSFPYTEPVIVKEGERVRMRFINVGYKSHFMHTHSHRFQVVARDGSFVNEPQKIDTVEIGPGQRVDVIFVADNPGTWPFHCHRLDHITNEQIYPGGMLTFIHYED
jgi:plastocyanin